MVKYEPSGAEPERTFMGDNWEVENQHFPAPVADEL